MLECVALAAAAPAEVDADAARDEASKMTAQAFLVELLIVGERRDPDDERAGSGRHARTPRFAERQVPKPYRRAAFPARMSSRSALGTPDIDAWIVRHEFGQSALMCG